VHDGAVRAVVVGPLLVFVTVSAAAQVESCGNQHEEDLAVVNRFIELVREGDRNGVADAMSFPLRRRYPLPSVSRAEFIERYGEIFDDEFVKVIVSSESDDCGRVGWRGLQLQNGLVWFTGRWVRAVNYESEFEKDERLRLIELEKRELHESLRKFHSPVLEWETCTFRVRIDRLDDGYRYAAWEVDMLHDSKPDLIIDNGEVEFHGSGGNHSFSFSNGEYKYVLDVELIGKGERPGELSVYRTDVKLIEEPIVSVGTESRYQALQKRLRNCS